MRPRLADPRKWNRPSAARHSPKGERESRPKGLDFRGAGGESLRLWVRGESHELDGFGAQAPSSTTGRTAAPAGDRRCGAAEFGLRGRARGSHRLQKSTGGARPVSPMREERVDNEVWSSLGARERSRGERAPEAGPSVAKRRVRWRALHLIGNGGRESALQRAPVDGRRLGPNQVVRLDERTMEAVLVFAARGTGAISLPPLRETENGGDDRGRQRSVAQLHRRRQRSGGAGTRDREPRRFDPREGTRREHRAVTG